MGALAESDRRASIESVKSIAFVPSWRKPNTLLLLGLVYKGGYKADWSTLTTTDKAEQSAHESACFFRLLPKGKHTPDVTALIDEITDSERTGQGITAVAFIDDAALNKFNRALPHSPVTWISASCSASPPSRSPSPPPPRPPT